MEKLSGWIAGIGAAFIKPAGYFWRPRSRPSEAADAADVQIAVAEVALDRTVADAGVQGAVGQPAVESLVVETTVESALLEHAVASEAERVQSSRLSVTSAISLDQQEIQRRRDLVRALFNDFWNGADDKPLTFIDRLNQAEPHLNARLSALDEPWQLDGNTRKLLGLPPRAH